MIRLTEDRAFIEGFNDVTSINEAKITFIYQHFNLDIEGKGLTVAAFSKHEMIIKGKLMTLSFHYQSE